MFKKLLLIFFAAIILIFICKNLFFFEESTDLILSNIFFGTAQTQHGIIFNNYECFYGINHIIRLLQSCSDTLNIYGLFLTLLNTVVILFIEYSLFTRLKAALQHRSITTLPILLLLFLFLYDGVFIHFNKTNIYLICTGLLLLLENEKRSRLQIIFITGCLFTGILIRAETFWLCLFYITLLQWKNANCLLQKKDARTMCLGLLLLGGGIIAFVNKQALNNDDKRYASLRPYKYTLIDFGQKEESYTVNNERDAIKLKLLQNAIFADSDSLMNTAVYKKLHILPRERFGLLQNLRAGNLSFRLQHAKNNFINIIYSEKPVLLCVIFILALSFYRSMAAKDQNLRKQIIWFLLVFFFIVFLLAFYIKMDIKVFNPLLYMGLYSILIKSGENDSLHFKKSETAVLVLFFFCVIILYGSFFISKLKKYERFNSMASLCIDKLNQSGYPKVCADINFFNLLIRNTYSMNRLSSDKKILLIDPGYLSMMNQHRKYNDLLLAKQGSTYQDLLRSLYQHKNDIQVIGSDNRLRLIENYARLIYHINLKFERVDSLPFIAGECPMGNIEINLYKIQ